MNYAYFDRNGELYDVSPRNNPDNIFEDREIAYQADIIVIDNKKYDLSNPDDIHLIPIPHFNARIPAVLELSNILKIRCGLVEDPNIMPAFVQKVLDLLEASCMLWSQRDILRTICNYYCVGLFDEGDAFEIKFRQNYPELFTDPNAEYEIEHTKLKAYFKDKWYRYQEYYKLREMFPSIVPATPKGYFQIRTRQTKRYLEIKELAEKSNIPLLPV